MTTKRFCPNLIGILTVDQLREVAAEVLGASVGLAGLLLVFVGFVYARGEALQIVARGEKFKNAARGGVILFGVLLWGSWLALNAMQSGALADYQFAMAVFRASLVLSGLYAFVVFFVHL